jgi:hypothetical protein
VERLGELLLRFAHRRLRAQKVGQILEHGQYALPAAEFKLFAGEPALADVSRTIAQAHDAIPHRTV